MSKIKSAYWDTLTSLDYELQDKLLAKQMSNQQYLRERLKTAQDGFSEVRQHQGTTELRKRLRERFKSFRKPFDIV